MRVKYLWKSSVFDFDIRHLIYSDLSILVCYVCNSMFQKMNIWNQNIYFLVKNAMISLLYGLVSFYALICFISFWK